MTFRPVTIEDGRVVEHRPESAHPEDTCQRCGGPNVVWFAPNDVWNRVMPDDGGILCPTCFVQLATAAGLDSIWCLAPSAHPVISLESRLAAVEAERAADTARLDWLEHERPRVGLGENGEVRLLDRWNDGSLIASQPTFREAIDAARRPPTPGDTP